MAEWTTILIPAVLFLATTIRSAFGFGDALIAVPLLALMIPVAVAAPVAVLVSITVASIALLQDWRDVHIRGAISLVLSTVVGIPVGLLLLKAVAEPIVKGLLGTLIAAFSIYTLINRAQRELHDDRLAWLFGFGAGMLGGAYGMNGPPLVVYGSLRKWSPQRFRATLQGYFFPASIIGMFGYWMIGLWTPEVSHLYLQSVPFIIAATFLGRMLNRRIDARRFLFYVHVSLIIIGVVLLFQGLAG